MNSAVSGQLVRKAVAAAGCIALAYACSDNTPTAPGGQPVQASFQQEAFKVATWNIRSGMGIRGFTTTNWDHTTVNCTDRSKPMNAWGMGLPQVELERIRADQSVIAMALQESWYCGAPNSVN